MHPSDDIASNLDLLFVAPTTSDPDKQVRVNSVVAAARAFADALLLEVPLPSSDRQEALVAIRAACDRAVSAVLHEPTAAPAEPDPAP